ncbi:UNVERIFIED_CONTAM: hypothetical protein HDU68_007685 [Siphonaria sp. JEL0065]|nr:hypothetical protein HDU68_007685 [Siphonaria sp. JEL0065]
MAPTLRKREKTAGPVTPYARPTLAGTPSKPSGLVRKRRGSIEGTTALEFGGDGDVNGTNVANEVGGSGSGSSSGVAQAIRAAEAEAEAVVVEHQTQHQKKGLFASLFSALATPVHSTLSLFANPNPKEKPTSLAARLKQELDARPDVTPRSSKLLNPNLVKLSPPVAKSALDVVDLTTAAYETSPSKSSSTSTSLKKQESFASPTKYDDIVAFLAKKGDQPLSLADAQKLNALIKNNVIQDEKVVENHDKANPFRQSVALELSDLAPEQQPSFTFQKPISSSSTSSSAVAPQQQQPSIPPPAIPLFTFGTTTSSTSTTASSSSLFGTSKPLFAPVFTFNAKATASSSIAPVSRPPQPGAGGRTRRTFRAPGQYTGASFGNGPTGTPRRTTTTSSSTRLSTARPSILNETSTSSNTMDLSEPQSKRHRVDEDFLVDDGNDAGKRRRGNTFGISDFVDSSSSTSSSSSDSASKLILESLDEMAPPPSNTLSLGGGVGDFSFGGSGNNADPFSKPVPPPTVVIHHIPRPSPAPSKIASKVKDVKAAISAGAKPKSALVNARISELKPSIGGTPSRSSSGSLAAGPGKALLKTAVAAAATAVGGSNSNSSASSISESSAVAAVPLKTTFPSFGTPTPSVKGAESAVASTANKKDIASVGAVEKPAFGFGVPSSKASTPAVAKPGAKPFEFASKKTETEKAEKDLDAPPTSCTSGFFNFGAAASPSLSTFNTPSVKKIEREKSPEKSVVAPVAALFSFGPATSTPSVAPASGSSGKSVSFAAPTTSGKSVSFAAVPAPLSSGKSESVWEQVAKMPLSELPKFDFGPSHVAAAPEVSFYLNKAEYLSLPIVSQVFDWTSESVSSTKDTVKESVPLVTPTLSSSSGGGGEKWNCPDCMVVNESSAGKCVCCEAVKPGSAPAVKPASVSLFSATAPSSSTAPTTATGFSFNAPPKNSGSELPGGFNWGKSEVVSSDKVGGGAIGGGFSGFSFNPVPTSTPAAAKEWICSRCFVPNKGEECISCGKAKGEGVVVKKSSKWVCEKCLIENEEGSGCAQCGVIKGGGGDALSGSGNGFSGGFSFGVGSGGGGGFGFSFGAK